VVVSAQEAAEVYPAAPQLAPLHCAVEFWHPPTPSQTFVRPQGVVGLQRLSVLPGPIGEQVPIPLMLQALQAVQLELPQQTLSTQLPELHVLAVAVVHAEPLGLRPQFFGAVPWQVFGGTQSLSLVQMVLQALVPQTKGVQGVVIAIEQAPLPLHAAGSMRVDPLHICMAHGVFVSACWQVPLPVQLPVLPQTLVFDIGHLLCRSGCPDGMLAHVPGLPRTLHAWQVPHDGDAQQTPSTQVRPLKQGFVAQL
jgi:hypothetical protein